MNTRHITILPAPGCRRSRRILEYLDQHSIPYSLVALDSLEGASTAERYNMRASPDILVDGVSVNPYELLIQPACRVNEEKAQALLFTPDTDQSQ